jgi:hypothetical protein
MGNWDYQRESATRTEAGDHRVEIVDAQQGISKSSGNDMIIVTVKPNGGNIKVQNYIVRNEYFNRNMTQFYDSFNIEEGNFDLLTWIGAVGAARLKEDEKGYLKVAWFIDKKKAEKLPPWVGAMPERQTVSEDFVAAEDDEMPDLPF